jgi:hypothetical protein
MVLNVDLNFLAQKYKMNVKKIIKLWQLGYSDEEVSLVMKINLVKLNALRNDLQQARWRATIKRKNIRTKNIIY